MPGNIIRSPSPTIYIIIIEPGGSVNKSRRKQRLQQTYSKVVDGLWAACLSIIHPHPGTVTRLFRSSRT
jgi:hypothetical protein